MTDNPNFPKPWPKQVSSLQVLRDAVATFQTAVQDALTRDTTKIVLRDQAIQGDPTVEENWHQHTIYANGSKMVVSSLTPGHRVSVRVRGINAAGAGAWSDIVTLIVG